ncbi:MAG: ribulose-phosphate 3-epimerase [Clostridiales bacterium]|nr:ribulose-phosphate 3-epimerase [Clostridiales bacterium]
MISPSMMCADIGELKETLARFEEEKIEYLHIDVMDGEFVPNFCLGSDYIRQIRRMTDIPLDIHLMITNPEMKLDYVEIAPGDIVSVHCEATRHIHKALHEIKKRGAKAFPALNPGTPISAVEEVTDLIDGVLIMTVNPGFAGQKMVTNGPKKVKMTKEFLKNAGIADKPVEVDGNVTYENAKILSQAGADIFVVGTSSIFAKNDSLNNNIRKMRGMIR